MSCHSPDRCAPNDDCFVCAPDVAAEMEYEASITPAERARMQAIGREMGRRNSWSIGCRVYDDGRPGPCGLYLDEHRLVDGLWTHPDERTNT